MFSQSQNMSVSGKAKFCSHVTDLKLIKKTMHGIVNSQLNEVICSTTSNNINQRSRDWSIRVANCRLEISTTWLSAPTDLEHDPTYTSVYFHEHSGTYYCCIASSSQTNLVHLKNNITIQIIITICMFILLCGDISL